MSFFYNCPIDADACLMTASGQCAKCEPWRRVSSQEIVESEGHIVWIPAHATAVAVHIPPNIDLVFGLPPLPNAAPQESRASASQEVSRVAPAVAAPHWSDCPLAGCQQFKKCMQADGCQAAAAPCDCPCIDDCDEAGECLKAMGMGCGGSWL